MSIRSSVVVDLRSLSCECTRRTESCPAFLREPPRKHDARLSVAKLFHEAGSTLNSRWFFGLQQIRRETGVPVTNERSLGAADPFSRFGAEHLELELHRAG